MRIIGASQEVVDPIEDKIQDIPLEVKISMAEVKESEHIPRPISK